LVSGWLALVAVLALVMVGIATRSRSRAQVAQPTGKPVAQAATNSPAAAIAPTNVTAATVAPRTVTTNLSFQLRPFGVTRTSETCEWTGEDGKDTNVIRRLAHNELEYQRMVEENNRIQRRQLVYRKDTAAAVMQRARFTGERVTQLTLPGFDGQELQFVVQRADLEASKQVGTFAGHLAGRPDSLVTLAYKFGREAFTVMSPDDAIYLQGHPRESGEIILTSFDPSTYQPVPGGEPIRAN